MGLVALVVGPRPRLAEPPAVAGLRAHRHPAARRGQRARDVVGADGAQRDRRPDRGHRPALDHAPRRAAAGRPALDGARVGRDARSGSLGVALVARPEGDVSGRPTGRPSSRCRWRACRGPSARSTRSRAEAAAARVGRGDRDAGGSPVIFVESRLVRRGLVAIRRRLRPCLGRRWRYLVVFGSLVGFTAFAYCLNELPASTVGTYAYVNPVVAVILGALILDEPLTPGLLAGGAADRPVGRADDAAQARLSASRPARVQLSLLSLCGAAPEPAQ